MRAERGKVCLVSDIPECDFCSDGTPGPYDFRTIDGPWAHGCEAHWEAFRASPELGVGHGQFWITEDGAAEPIRAIRDLATFQRGVLEALQAASEEHDRDVDEVICPLNVAEIQTEGVLGDRDFTIFAHLPDGRVFSINAEEVS